MTTNDKHLDYLYSIIKNEFHKIFKSKSFNFIKPSDIPITKGDIIEYIYFSEGDIRTLKSYHSNKLAEIYINLDNIMEDYGGYDCFDELKIEYNTKWDDTYGIYMKKLIILGTTLRKLNKLIHDFRFENTKKMWKDKTLLDNKDKNRKELKKQYKYELRYYGKKATCAEAQGCFEAINELLLKT